MNKREEIRKRITSEIKTAFPSLRIYSHRSQALQKWELPALVVWLEREACERVSSDLGYRMQSTARVEILGMGGVDWVDRVSKKIENVLLSGENRQLGDVMASKFEQMSTEISLQKEGELDIWTCVMTFLVEYYSEPEDSEASDSDTDIEMREMVIV